MPKKTTFGKEDVKKLILLLKEENITEISFNELAHNMSKYIPNHNKGITQLILVLMRYSKLFDEAKIKIYSYRDRKREEKRKQLKDVLLYFKNNLNKNIITIKELQSLLLDKYNFRFHPYNGFYKTYDVRKLMQEVNISFKTQDKKKENTLQILKKFSKTSIVKQYIQEGHKFTASELCKQIKNIMNKELSIGTIYNYSDKIIKLNIPLRSNKIIENSEKYDEKDIINKISAYLKEGSINKIYAGKFSKLGERFSLPNIGAKKTLIYKDYIYDIYKIKIVTRDDSKKEQNKLKNTLEDNLEYLSQVNNIKVIYMEDLPEFNSYCNTILVSNLIDDNLYNYWIEYLKEYISNLSLNRISVNKELVNNERKLTIDTENKKIFFLLHKKLHVKNLKILDFIKLSKKEVLANDKLYGIHRQNMFLGFLIYLYSKGQILLSTEFIYNYLYKRKKVQSEIELFIKNNVIYQEFLTAKKQNRLTEKEINTQRLICFFILTINYKESIGSLQDSYFDNLNLITKTLTKRLKKIFNKISANLNISKTKLQFTKEYYDYMKHDNFKDFILICNSFMDKKVKLNQTKTPNSYYRHTSSKIVKFIKFCDQYHKGLKLNKENLELIFNFPESKLYTYQEYVDGLSFSDNTKSSMLNIFVEIFANTKDYTGICTREKIPHYNTNPSWTREAIEDDEIIYKIDDIVTNRPPKSEYFLNHKVKMDMSWWKHLDRVRPFEPLLIKTHLRIPVRGDSLRKIDRDLILQKNSDGSIKGFYFISDKNKNRREPFIVPNIWKSELNYLEKLVEYNKLYFPNLKRFYPDDTSIKNGILPLFPNQDGTSSYTNGQHLHYWTKVLILAQMEFEQEGKNHNLVYSEEVELPKNMEEFDNLTSQEIKSFKRRYDIHSLRHTGITRNIRAGMPLELVRLLSGHSGYNTILTIYYHVNQEEMVQDWLNKYDIDIGTELNMHKVSQLFINKEIIDIEIKSVNHIEILNILKKNHFFNPQNRTLAFKENITLESISKSDPKFWKPVNGGICTKQRCPEDILGRCSLCPYFITNYRFIHDLGLNMQMSMARVQKYSDMVIKNREANKNSENVKLRKMMDYEIEDFTAWLEILSLAKDSYNELKDENNNKTNTLISNNIEEKDIFNIVPALNIEHGYLEILSQAFKKKVYDNETITDITTKIANKLIRYHAKNGTYSDIEHLNNEAIVKSFLPKYEQYSTDWLENPESQKQIEYLLNQIDNNKQLEQKNENTFLTCRN
jgi:hypothetical protein